MQREPTYVGIDVAKEMLGVALRPAGERWRVALDAAVLAHFGEAVRPPLRALRDAESLALKALLGRRQQLVTMLVAERNRRGAAGAAVRPRIEAHIAWLEQERSELEDELRQTLQRNLVWRERDQLLRSVPGVGEQLSLTLLAELPELGRLNRRAIAGPGRGRALQPRQRQAARQTHDLGRARAGARRALHGRAQRQPLQPADPRLLPTPARGWQAQKGGPHRLHAQAARDPQRDAQTPHALARPEPQQHPLS